MGHGFLEKVKSTSPPEFKCWQKNVFSSESLCDPNKTCLCGLALDLRFGLAHLDFSPWAWTLGKTLSSSGLSFLICKIGTLAVGPEGLPVVGGRAHATCSARLRPAPRARFLPPWGRYSGRSDAGCLYELTVKLLSEHEDVLAEFNSGQVAVPQDSEEGGWTEVSGAELGAGPGCDGQSLRTPRPMGGAGLEGLRAVEEGRRDSGLRNLVGV